MLRLTLVILINFGRDELFHISASERDPLPQRIIPKPCFLLDHQMFGVCGLIGG